MNSFHSRLFTLGLFVALCLMLPTAPSAHAELTAKLVKDINTLGTQSSQPSNFTVVGSLVYFTASDGFHGLALWKSDGTAAGTNMVMDFNSGTGGPNAISLVSMQGKLFFTDSSGRLWKLDPQFPNRFELPGNHVSDLTLVGNTIFFAAEDASAGIELWKSDGTAEGTVPVADLNPGAASSNPDALINVNGALFFRASSENDYSLWKSDGTASGTTRIISISPLNPSLAPPEQLALGNTLFFVNSTTSSGSQIWKSDGSAAGTIPITALDPALVDNAPGNLTAMNDMLFFNTTKAGQGSIWKSNGQPGGTSFLSASAPIANLIAIGSTLFFEGYDPEHGNALWKSDGSTAGTAMLAELVPGSEGTGLFAPIDVNGTLFVRNLHPNDHGFELWRSDGTPAGTQLVSAVVEQTLLRPPPTIYLSQVILGNRLWFVGADAAHGPEPWISDGSKAGTGLLKDINTIGTGSEIYSLVPMNGALYFLADQGNGRQLWRSNGTEVGTKLVKDILVRSELVRMGDTLFFAGVDPEHGIELWRSDGTEAGTSMAVDITPGSYDSFPSNLAVQDGMLFFSAFSGDRSGLWKSDGTAEGTSFVKAVFARNLTVVDNKLFFVGTSDGADEFWISDGSSEGTNRLAGLDPGSGVTSFIGQLMVNVQGTVFFHATTNLGEEIWRSDGSKAGTFMLLRMPRAENYFYRPFFTAIGDIAFFVADDVEHGLELWQSDGTVAGTRLVADINPGPGGSYPQALTDVNGTLFFSAFDGSQNALWKSDGTQAGTIAVKTGIHSYHMLAVGTRLLLVGGDDAHGFELWQSDGTSAGTTLVSDILPGVDSSYPYYLTYADEMLFFTADLPAFGTELWVIDLFNLIDTDGLPVSSDGADLHSRSGQVQLAFPADAVSEEVLVTLKELSAPSQSTPTEQKALRPFSVQAVNRAGKTVTTFSRPLRLVISYTDEELASQKILESTFNLAYWNGKRWIAIMPCAGCYVDTSKNQVAVEVYHLTEFVLLGSDRVSLSFPLVIR